MNKNVKLGSWELIRRAKETKANRAKHVEYKQKIIRLLEESAHCPVLFHIFISNLNENIKLLHMKLDFERKKVRHFSPVVRNITDVETKSTVYTSALLKESFSKAVLMM